MTVAARRSSHHASTARASGLMTPATGSASNRPGGPAVLAAEQARQGGFYGRSIVGSVTATERSPLAVLSSPGHQRPAAETIGTNRSASPSHLPHASSRWTPMQVRPDGDQRQTVRIMVPAG